MNPKPNVRKRALSLFLALLMCLTLTPLPTLADSSENYIEAHWFDNNRKDDYGNSTNDGYLTTDSSGGIDFNISGWIPLEQNCTIKNVWLVDATSKAKRYDLLDSAYGGVNESEIFTYTDPDTQKTDYSLMIWISNITIPNVSLGDYRLKVVTSDLTYLSDDVADEYMTVHGIVHIVKPEDLLTGPTITTSSLPDGKVGVAYSAQLEATAAYGGTVTWEATDLPDGLKLNKTTGALSGTPTEKGNYTFKATAKEAGGGSTDKLLTIKVAEADPPVITTSSLPDGRVGDAYSAALSATPFIAGRKITWSIKSGSLPKGITLDAATGTLSGTPSAKGSYTFKVSASEANGGSAVQSLTIQVTVDPPMITTASLPDGMADKEYSAKLAAKPFVNGKAITWSVSSGSLPYGLSLDPQTGEISGSPYSPGTESFTVCASEADGENAYKELSITVEQKPIALTEDPYIVLSYVGENTLYDSGEYSIYLYMNRDPEEGEDVTGVLEYTDKSNSEKEYEFSLKSNYYGTADYRGKLPEDAGKINSFKFAIGGKEAAVSKIDLAVAPVLTISFSGEITSGADPYMWVKDEDGLTVYSQYVGGTTQPVTLKNLPEGSYTLETWGYVSDYGDLSFGSAEAVLTNGKTTNVTLELTDHRALRICPQPKAGDSAVGWWGRSFAWYSDAEGTQLISTADNYSVLDDEAVYLRVSPKGACSVDYTDSELVKVTRETDKNIIVPFTRKAAVTAEITAAVEEISGSGVFAAGDFWITVSRPGAGNYVSSSRDYGYAGKTYTAENITEGTVITVSARSGYSVSEDHSSVSHTVTAAEIKAGKLQLNAAVPLNEGRIYLDVTRRTLDSTSQGWLRDINSFTVTKADGSELAYRKTDTAFVLTEPEKIAVGETLTVYAQSWNNTFGPDSDGEVKLTVQQDDQGKKYLKGSLVMTQRRTVYFIMRRTVTGPLTMLIYKGDGSLFKADDELFGGYNAQRTGTNSYFGGLLPDKYTFVLVDSRYFATLAPEDYDTVSEGRALPYSGYDETDLTARNDSVSIKLGNDDVAPEYSKINKDLSMVTMKKSYNNCVTLDMTVVTKPSFAPDGGVTLRIETNQLQNDLSAGAVSTYALSVNGFPIDIDRWNSYNAGLIQTDGSLQLTLSKEMLEACGGFPLEFSTAFKETNYENLSCSAYLICNQGGKYSVDYIGSYEEVTGFITVEAPEVTADGEFTVWGTAMPSAKSFQGYADGKQMDYNITLFADGVPVAETKTDNRGHFKAKVLVNTEDMKEYDGIEFTASGSYTDGSFARVSDTVTTLYTPNEGVLKKYEIFWESHQGDAEKGMMQSMVILDDGDPVSLDRLWYRGATSSDDKARIQWKMTFDNPDEITSVSVDVPRNGYIQIIDAVKQKDGTWLTPLTYIPGSAPDGSTVSYSVKTKPNHLIREDDTGYTDDQLRSVYNRLASTSLISGLTVSGNKMSFDLKGKKNSLPVLVTSKELDWDNEEVEDLDTFEPVFSYGDEEGDLLPNVILSQEGWFEGRLVDGFEGDEYIFGSRTINKYTEDFGTVYISRVLTATRCVTVVWDTANKEKSMTVIDIGKNVQHNPGKNEELEKKIAESSLTEEQADLLRVEGNADTVYDIWNAFYTQLAAAFSEGAKAEVNGDPLTETAVFTGSMNASSADVPNAPSANGGKPKTKKLDLNKSENWQWKNVREAAEQLKKAKEAGKNLGDWGEEIDVTNEEIAKLHLFLKDNDVCLRAVFRYFDSSGDSGLFDIVPEIRTMFGQRMTMEVVNALNDATSFGKDFSEKGIKAAWDKLGDVLTTGGFLDRMKGSKFKEKVREEAWGRKSTNMARRLYYATKYIEKYLHDICSGINYTNWPKDIYDYDDWRNRGDRERVDKFIARYHQKVLTPVNYRKQSSPPGPQGRYDPSGYVYEAVPSNRVEGATVTLFTLNGELDVTRDTNYIITGISGGTAVFADSAQFGIEPNPQTTGEDGRYQWFVPEGWWRVKVTAEGFEDADTGDSRDYGLNAVLNSKDNCYYMPVLPVQLDVNIPLVSYAAPEVDKIDATTLGLLVKFSKYMDEESLKKDHFILLVNGEIKPFKLVMTDSEKSSTAEDAPSYTSTLLLTYEGAAEGDKVQLAIDNRVKSYSGVQMNERYDSGELTVKAPKQVSRPEADIPSGQVEKNTAVALSCSTDGAVIRYTTDGSEPTEKSPVYTAPIFVSEEVTIKAAAFKAGMLPSDVLTVSYTVPEETVIIVPEAVVATMNGKIVSDGDILTPGYLTLTTATEGAEIWYTTNGVCPRFDPDPIKYTEPIYLEPGTYYFRIRSFLNGEWSEGLPLHLTVTEGDAKVFTVTFETNGGSAVAAQKVNEGDKAVKPADPIKDGYTFSGWYRDNELTEEYDFDAPVTADITVYAKWTKRSEPAVKYKITFDLNGGTLDGKTGSVTIEAEAGTTIILPKPQKEGYTFDHWEGSEYKAGASYTVTGDHTFKAQWKKKTADGTVNPNTGSKNICLAVTAVSVIAILCILLSGKKRRSKK